MPVSRVSTCRFHSWSSVLSAFLVFVIGLPFAAVQSATAQSTRAKLLSGAETPAYPEEARAKMIVGDVVFRATLTEEGSVEAVHILQVPEKNIGFEDTVEQTVKEWKFEPARTDGKPVASAYLGKIGFSLRPEEEKAIGELVERVMADWNKGDASKLASHFHKKEGRIQGEQELARSSDGVKKWISDQLSGALKDAELKLALNRIEFFPAPDLARVISRFTMEGVSGQPQPLMGQVSVVLLKDNNRWTALSAQLVSRLGSVPLQAPQKIKEVPPVYPTDAQKERVQGTVVLEGTVDKAGKVTEVEVVRSVRLLDQAAIDAVKQWEYEPALVAGEPAPMLTTMAVNFTLE